MKRSAWSMYPNKSRPGWWHAMCYSKDLCWEVEVPMRWLALAIVKAGRERERGEKR